MSARIAKLAIALLLTSGVASTAQAQASQLDSGPRLSHQVGLEEFRIGAQLGVPVAPHSEVHPSFDYFFVQPGSFSSVNGGLKYRIATESIDWLYVGGGLKGTNRFGNSRDGLSLFAGFESLSGRVHRFGEFRFTAKDGSTAQASVGLNFMLGSSSSLESDD